MPKITLTKVKPAGKLAAIIGEEPVSYTQITSKVCNYIKTNGLKKGNLIVTDAKLAALCEGKKEVLYKELLKFIHKPGNIIK